MSSTRLYFSLSFPEYPVSSFLGPGCIPFRDILQDSNIGNRESKNFYRTLIQDFILVASLYFIFSFDEHFNVYAWNIRKEKYKACVLFMTYSSCLKLQMLRILLKLKLNDFCTGCSNKGVHCFEPMLKSTKELLMCRT